MKKIDNAVNDYVMKANLVGQTCALKHGKKSLPKDHPAIDYLSQNMVDGAIVIPVCQECVNALHGNDWVLLYCVNCNQSQWVCKRYAKRRYKDNEHVIFMTACPHCYKKETIN